MSDEFIELLTVEDRTSLAMRAALPTTFQIRVIVLFIALGLIPQVEIGWGIAIDVFEFGTIDRIYNTEFHGTLRLMV